MSIQDGSSGATPGGQHHGGNLAPEAPPASPSPTAPPQNPGTNTLSVVGLILAFLFAPIGFILSVVGLVQANRRRQNGKGLAIAGIAVSLIIMMLGGLLLVTVFRNAATLADPGCTAGKSAILDNADIASGDPANARAAIQRSVDELTAASAQAKDPDVRAAVNAIRDDFTALLKAIDTGTQPDPNLQTKLDADADRLDELCTLGGAE